VFPTGFNLSTACPKIIFGGGCGDVQMNAPNDGQSVGQVVLHARMFFSSASPVGLGVRLPAGSGNSPQ
jgi:hypothetical protein